MFGPLIVGISAAGSTHYGAQPFQARPGSLSRRGHPSDRDRSHTWGQPSATSSTACFSETCFTTCSAMPPQEMNNISSATEYYREVLKQDNTHVEAIACIGSNHFYTDQPEIALRFYRWNKLPVNYWCAAWWQRFVKQLLLFLLPDACSRWGCTTASCTTTWACAASTPSSMTWLCPLSRGRWPWWATMRSRLTSGTTSATWLWWVSAGWPGLLLVPTLNTEITAVERN